MTIYLVVGGVLIVLGLASLLVSRWARHPRLGLVCGLIVTLIGVAEFLFGLGVIR